MMASEESEALKDLLAESWEEEEEEEEKEDNNTDKSNRTATTSNNNTKFSAPVRGVLWFTFGVLCTTLLDSIFVKQDALLSDTITTVTTSRCSKKNADNSDCSSSKANNKWPKECFNTTSALWMGHWDLNPNISKPNSKNPADIDMGQRYHSLLEDECKMTDILKLSVNEIIAGHTNDAMELAIIERLKGLKGKSLLQIGTSVDNRNLRWSCPNVFGQNRQVFKDGDIALSTCEIPLIDFTLVYTFNDALTKAHNTTQEQKALLERIDQLCLNTTSLSPPEFILLSGIEWDLKWYKDLNKQQQQEQETVTTIDWNYTRTIVEQKVNLFQSHYSEATALFLRTQPFQIGREGSLAAKEDFEIYNDLFEQVVQRKQNANQNKPCGSVHLADLEKLMMLNGTGGWSDGVHPAGWVSMQYLNILLNLMASLGEIC